MAIFSVPHRRYYLPVSGIVQFCIRPVEPHVLAKATRSCGDAIQGKLNQPNQLVPTAVTHVKFASRTGTQGDAGGGSCGVPHTPVLVPPVHVEVRDCAEDPSALGADGATLVQRPVVTQRVPALERLVADRAAQDGRGVTCRAQQQRVKIVAQRQPSELPHNGSASKLPHNGSACIKIDVKQQRVHQNCHIQVRWQIRTVAIGCAIVVVIVTCLPMCSVEYASRAHLHSQEECIVVLFSERMFNADFLSKMYSLYCSSGENVHSTAKTSSCCLTHQRITPTYSMDTIIWRTNHVRRPGPGFADLSNHLYSRAAEATVKFLYNAHWYYTNSHSPRKRESTRRDIQAAILRHYLDPDRRTCQIPKTNVRHVFIFSPECVVLAVKVKYRYNNCGKICLGSFPFSQSCSMPMHNKTSNNIPLLSKECIYYCFQNKRYTGLVLCQ